MVLDVLDKEKFLKENEVLNDLLGYDGLKIIQNPEMFNFSLDSTLLILQGLKFKRCLMI